MIQLAAVLMRLAAKMGQVPELQWCVTAGCYFSRLTTNMMPKQSAARTMTDKVANG